MSATSHRGGASAIRSQPLRLLARVAAILLAAMTLSAPRTLAQVGTRPARVISLVPSVTEMIFAMGAGSIVVGVSSYDHFPPDVATRPRLGALVDPDFERILTLHPDLVIAYGSQEDLVRRLDAKVSPPGSKGMQSILLWRGHATCPLTQSRNLLEHDRNAENE